MRRVWFVIGASVARLVKQFAPNDSPLRIYSDPFEKKILICSHLHTFTISLHKFKNTSSYQWPGMNTDQIKNYFAEANSG